MRLARKIPLSFIAPLSRVIEKGRTSFVSRLRFRPVKSAIATVLSLFVHHESDELFLGESTIFLPVDVGSFINYMPNETLITEAETAGDVVNWYLCCKVEWPGIGRRWD